jgi:alpha-glucosidase
MWDMVRHWLRMGVDGFRLDAVTTIFEDPQLRDHEADIDGRELTRRFAAIRSPEDFAEVMKVHDIMFAGQVELPGLHELLRELRQIVDEFPDRVLIGESANLSYHGNGTDELHMVFNFPLMHSQPFKPADVLANQRERLPQIPKGAWPCNTLGNHDSGRSFSRLNETPNPDAQARLSLALMLTLPGTPVLYYGEEIGMTDLLLHDPAAIRDLYVFQVYPEFAPGNTLTPEEALKMARFTRDRCRTPMQWSGEPDAGFSPVEVVPWLPVNPNHRDGINVRDQTAKSDSLLEFYRHLIALRRSAPALLDGEFETLDGDTSSDCLVFLRRRKNGECCLVALNFSAETQPMPAMEGVSKSKLLLSEAPQRLHQDPESPSSPLAPFEIRLCFMDS